MDFIRARTEEQIATRESEIVSACDRIYSERGYDAVNFKAISEITSITRPSIYNYYNTKEEIFLDLLKYDYNSWYDEMKKGFNSIESMSHVDFCKFLTETLTHHQRMLEMLSKHLTVIEESSSLEKLIEFKKVICKINDLMHFALDKYFDSPEEVKKSFILMFFAYLHGVYPLSHPTDKQAEAMKVTGCSLSVDFDVICYDGLIKLVADL